MTKYQISENFGNDRHAGSKAKNDAVAILKELDFKELSIRHMGSKPGLLAKISRQLRSFISWTSLKFKVEDGSILIRQNPFHNRQMGRRAALKYLKEKRNVYMISLVHDVELIRYQYNSENFKNEFDEMIEFADKLIIHNEAMKQWFLDYGVSEEKLVVLEIFDYLLPLDSQKEIHFSKNIYIAGNLARDKSPYVHQLKQLSHLNFKLMGINYEPDTESQNIDYLGSFAPEEVPNQLVEGFGLVWDGNDIDTCSGETGNYLRYNNPHKLSLYLASEIPVIVWKEAAEANFVLNNGVGFAVDSLFELESIFENLTEEEYFKMVENVRRISTRIQSGQYLKEAVEKIV
ncbi:sugar transferase [Streptococcus danieliae]|uniref:Glycosyl transferase n=1 Tax=Streptococcus danieliae TaxID=747656 RepID=A0A7X3KBF4_9STRE|nr:sugar transferase [Streptococcus danieliae]MBF0699727.1 sugar transferase [Streptococcus danieliae]MVX58510.1 glycosyl transferase [Streptococcus danieliae]NYS96903.1 sugar transferase [Streptococcus danieliae]